MKKLLPITISQQNLETLFGNEYAVFKEKILRNVFCTTCNNHHCIIVQYSASLNELNDVLLQGKCAICGSAVRRSIETGEDPLKYKRAMKIRSILTGTIKEKNPVYSVSDRLWGQDGPYSQVRRAIETRILEDHVSRIFITVEVDINPYTYELLVKNRALFQNDSMIQHFLDHSDYRGQEFGYVCQAFSKEYSDESALEEAREEEEFCKQTIIKMHIFVMEQLGLKKSTKN